MPDARTGLQTRAGPAAFHDQAIGGVLAFGLDEALNSEDEVKPTVFISYSHKDERWKDRLVRHLDVLVSEDELAVWDDRKIGAGDDWLAAIEKALADAQVAVLLVTADFLRSDFIRRKEVPTLLQRRESEGVWVVPLLVMPCPWQAVDWLSNLQIRPKGAKPLAGGKKHQIEDHLSALALEIRHRVGTTAEKAKAEKEPLVDLNLSTEDPGVWIPPEGTPWLEEAQVLNDVPELARLADADGEVLYEMVEFEAPESADRVRGLWNEHLDVLVKARKIFRWSPGQGNGVILGLIHRGRLAACKLHNSQMLSRATVIVPECRPLRQEPVPGSRTAVGEMRYPDLPIKSDYWQLSHGERSRLYIARALLQRADLLAFDESFAELDLQNLDRQAQVRRHRPAADGRRDGSGLRGAAGRPLALRRTPADPAYPGVR